MHITFIQAGGTIDKDYPRGADNHGYAFWVRDPAVKSVVFTGAMLPEKFVNSDARFNVGMAAAAVQLSAPGVYVALYGSVVPWDQFKSAPSPFEGHLT